MAHCLTAPRINNNDDSVKIASFDVALGDFVRAGDAVALIETDKAVVELEADRDGFLLAFVCEPGQSVPVGGVVAWLGERVDEPVPEAPTRGNAPSRLATAGTPTAKARELIAAHGLDPALITHAGKRITVKDVEAFLATGAPEAPAPQSAAGARPNLELPPARLEHLAPIEHGMLRTVRWHRDEAVATYLELAYDSGPWQAYAEQVTKQRQHLVNPLLPLMAHRLVRLCIAQPRLNTSLIEGPQGARKVVYEHVNLGFTVQTSKVLYLVVLHEAEALSEADLVASLLDLQRRAMGHKLTPSEMAGATVSFSSMARWNVTRHVPILPRYSALTVAHSAPQSGPEWGPAVLGATYDHRVLTGADVFNALRRLTTPKGVS